MAWRTVITLDNGSLLLELDVVANEIQRVRLTNNHATRTLRAEAGKVTNTLVTSATPNTGVGSAINVANPKRALLNIAYVQADSS